MEQGIGIEKSEENYFRQCGSASLSVKVMLLFQHEPEEVQGEKRSLNKLGTCLREMCFIQRDRPLRSLEMVLTFCVQGTREASMDRAE